MSWAKQLSKPLPQGGLHNMQGSAQRSDLSPLLHENGVCQLEVVNEGHSTITGCCDSVNTLQWFPWLSTLLQGKYLLLIPLKKERAYYCHCAVTRSFVCPRVSCASQQSIKHPISALNTEGVKQNISANKVTTELQREIHELISGFSTIQWLSNILKKYGWLFPKKNCF